MRLVGYLPSHIQRALVDDDHVVGELETRFSVQCEGLITAQNLFPLYLPKLTHRDIEKIKNYFSKHLDFSEKSNFEAELARWRMKHAMKPDFRTRESPTPSEAMDSVINDRRWIKWPCYAVNSSRNGFHSTPKEIYDMKSN